LAIFAPLWIVPALVHDAGGRALVERRTGSSSTSGSSSTPAIGTYFLTEYFFDVLGMVYNYPAPPLDARLGAARAPGSRSCGHDVPARALLLRHVPLDGDRRDAAGADVAR
jgi:hypothetical protein